MFKLHWKTRFYFAVNLLRIAMSLARNSEYTLLPYAYPS